MRPNTSVPGDIINLNGEVVGTHEGIIKYTVGQRKGIGIQASVPMFVLNINANKNTITIGPREALRQAKFYIDDVNWLDDESFDKLLDQQKIFLLKLDIKEHQYWQMLDPYPIKRRW